MASASSSDWMSGHETLIAEVPRCSNKSVAKDLHPQPIDCTTRAVSGFAWHQSPTGQGRVGFWAMLDQKAARPQASPVKHVRRGENRTLLASSTNVCRGESISRSWP